MAVLGFFYPETARSIVNSPATNTTNAATGNANTNNANRNANARNTNANINARLEAAKLRVCQNRESAITRILERAARRVNRQLEVFNTIAQRVEAFYLDRGYSVSNYAALVTDIDAKRDLVETQVGLLAKDTTFSCTGDDPRGAITAWLNQRQLTNDALKDYRTAIRNLIVAVKSAQGRTASNTNASVQPTNSANTND